MELDLTDNTKLIYSTRDNGFYSGGSQITTKTFKDLYGFTQIDNNTILFASDNCIRTMTRKENDVALIAGLCGRDGYGYSDEIGNTKFHNPNKITSYPGKKNNYLIADSRNAAIRLLDVKQQNVTTLLRKRTFKAVFFCVWHPEENDALLFGTVNNIDVYYLKENRTVKFTNPASFPQDIAFLFSDLYLIVDPGASYGENNIIVFDVTINRTTDVTSTFRSPIDDDNYDMEPFAILKNGSDIYIGFSDGILKTTGEVFKMQLSSVKTVHCILLTMFHLNMYKLAGLHFAWCPW